MSFFVYALCALTSSGCCVLLLRQHKREPGKLLFHSAMTFLCFAIANVLLFVDLIVVPQVDLRFWRTLTTLIGVLILLVALINLSGKDER